MINIAFKFEGQELFISGSEYPNGRLALVICSDPNSNGPIYTILTTNLPKRYLGEDEFFVKTWAENEKVTDYLRESGIFENTLKRVSTGFVYAEVWKFKTNEEEETIKSDPEPLRRR